VTPETAKECPLCQGTGWVVEEGQAVRCGCYQERRSRRLLEEARIPARYDHCLLETYIAQNEVQERALDLTRQLVKAWPDVEKGLLYMGPCGVGKTHLAVAALRALVREKGVWGIFADYQDLLRRIQASYSPDSQTSEHEVLRPVLEAELLLLDDLGGARSPTPWVFDTLFHVLNTRYNERRLTQITMNPPAPADRRREAGSGMVQDWFQERVGERLRSRLFEMCDQVPISGEDFRRKEFGERKR